jgi:hypothetical protein
MLESHEGSPPLMISDSMSAIWFSVDILTGSARDAAARSVAPVLWFHA